MEQEKVNLEEFKVALSNYIIDGYSGKEEYKKLAKSLENFTKKKIKHEWFSDLDEIFSVIQKVDKNFDEFSDLPPAEKLIPVFLEFAADKEAQEKVKEFLGILSFNYDDNEKRWVDVSTSTNKAINAGRCYEFLDYINDNILPEGKALELMIFVSVIEDFYNYLQEKDINVDLLKNYFTDLLIELEVKDAVRAFVNAIVYGHENIEGKAVELQKCLAENHMLPEGKEFSVDDIVQHQDKFKIIYDAYEDKDRISKDWLAGRFLNLYNELHPTEINIDIPENQIENGVLNENDGPYPPKIDIKIPEDQIKIEMPDENGFEMNIFSKFKEVIQGWWNKAITFFSNIRINAEINAEINAFSEKLYEIYDETVFAITEFKKEAERKKYFEENQKDQEPQENQKDQEDKESQENQESQKKLNYDEEFKQELDEKLNEMDRKCAGEFKNLKEKIDQIRNSELQNSNENENSSENEEVYGNNYVMRFAGFTSKQLEKVKSLQEQFLKNKGIIRNSQKNGHNTKTGELNDLKIGQKPKKRNRIKSKDER